MADNKVIHIIGGGTVQHVRSHLALCAPAYGSTARAIATLCEAHPDNKLDVELHLSRMAGGRECPRLDDPRHLETNADVAELVDSLVADERTKIVFFNPAMCDFKGRIYDNGEPTHSGKYANRLRTDQGSVVMELVPSEKVVGRIRKVRKDITLVAFKTTSGATQDEQYIAGLNLLKRNSCNLVLANDILTRTNMVITPEEARYHVTRDREEALSNLVDMAINRSHLTFTRSTVVAGESVPWSSPDVPEALRKVVDACIDGGAYKPFNGATVGHFAAKLADGVFLTSKRKTNFNDLARNGLVRVTTDGPDFVIAHGAKPSVGGQSQRIVFSEHPEYDCIVHFHCPFLYGHPDVIPLRSQRDIECGSHECGANTSGGLREFDLGGGTVVSAVMLDNHGPNIVFHRSADPLRVVAFIRRNWDLSKKVGGYVSLPDGTV